MEERYPAENTSCFMNKRGIILFKNTEEFSRYFHTDIDEKEKEKEDDDKRFFLCKICRNSITPYETKTSIGGCHRHTFQNPAGFEYSIGCFSSAEGCFETGIPTAQYTWFPGYRWCYALCSKCRGHLGWSYRSPAGSFYGLILDSLIVS